MSQRLREYGFSESRQVFNQQVAPGQQTGQREGNLSILAENNAANRRPCAIEGNAVRVFARGQFFDRISARHSSVLVSTVVRAHRGQSPMGSDPYRRGYWARLHFRPARL